MKGFFGRKKNDREYYGNDHAQYSGNQTQPDHHGPTPGPPPGPPPNTAQKPMSAPPPPGPPPGQSQSSGSRGDAPKMLNVRNNDVMHERFVLVHGNAGPKGLDGLNCGNVVVTHHLNEFPSQRFPVADNYFKAFVHLAPGPNQLCVTYEYPDNRAPVSTSLTLIHTPLLQDPPLHLCLILGRDSKGEFQSQSYKKQIEGNSLELAVKKMRMAGYMMSAFTNEIMLRNGFGNRTFRFHEEWDVDTMSNRESKSCRSTIKVHIVRSELSVAEINSPDYAQQNSDGKDTGKLFNIAYDALKRHGLPFTQDEVEHRAACVFVDSEWNTKRQLITGHAALGGGISNVRLAIFGGHALWTWPSCVEELVPALLDNNVVDVREVANDSRQSGSAWEALNVSQGAFMHEIGHLLGCPHQPDGIMLRGYLTWNRSFLAKEVTLGKGFHRPCLPADECSWHRLDALRFRHHPSFRLPHEHFPSPGKPNLYPVENGTIAKATSGIYLVEVHVEDWCRGHLEFAEDPQREVFLFDHDLRQAITDPKYRDPSKPMRLEILSVGGQVTIDDFSKALCARDHNNAFQSYELGNKIGDETKAYFGHHNLVGVRLYAGDAVDGVEFLTQGSSVIFGKKGGSMTEIIFEPGEHIVGFFVRAGYWLDAIQLITNKRRSPLVGKSGGGDPHELVPPTGYRLVGMHGHMVNWLYGIGVVYEAVDQ